MEFSHRISLELRRCLKADGSIGVSGEGFGGGEVVSAHELLEHLLQYGARELALAALCMQKERFSRLLAAEVGINAPDVNGFAPLHHVFYQGQPEPVYVCFVNSATQLLLKFGADPDAVAPNGRTPLQLALENGWLVPARQLRMAGARRCGDVVFDAAPSNEPDASRDVVAWFLKGGGHLEMPPGGPMRELSDEEYMGCRKLGVQEQIFAHNRKTLLFGAVESNDLPLAQALAEADASLAQNRGILTAAACTFDPEMLRFVLGFNVRVNHRDWDEATALVSMLYRFHDLGRWDQDSQPKKKAHSEAVASCTRLLLDAGAEVGCSALYYASCSLEVFDLVWPLKPLLSPDWATKLLCGIVDALPGDARPELSRADFARQLLALGANPNLEYENFVSEEDLCDQEVYFDNKNLSQAAERSGDEELFRLLVDAGAKPAPEDDLENYTI